MDEFERHLAYGLYSADSWSGPHNALAAGDHRTAAARVASMGQRELDEGAARVAALLLVAPETQAVPTTGSADPSPA